MTTITKYFAEQANGYDKQQVSRYIQKLSDEYSKLHSKFNELANQHDELLKQSFAKREAISKALVDAETKAIEILTDAKAEAARIVESAHSEFQEIQQENSLANADIYRVLTKLRNAISTVA